MGRSVSRSRFRSIGSPVIGTLALVLGWASAAQAGDVIPFFKPDAVDLPEVYGPLPPHPIATECSLIDEECVNGHDIRALNAAVAAHDVDACVDATDLSSCVSAYQMITGTTGMRADAVLDDPCSWVVLVDEGIATIRSKRLGVTRFYADRGWKARSFLGACDVSKLAPAALETAIPLPRWEARKPAPTGARAVAAPAPSAPSAPATATVPPPPVAVAPTPAPAATPLAPTPAPLVPVSTMPRTAGPLIRW